MEVKLVVSVDDKTADLINSLVNAIVGNAVKGVASIKYAKQEESVAAEENRVEEKVATKTKGAKKGKFGSVAEDVETEIKTESDVTLDEVRKALAEAKHRCGSIEPCKALVKKYGASGLSSLDPVHYTEVIAALAKL